MLMVDPATNATDNATLAVGSGSSKFGEIVFVASVNRLYSAPRQGTLLIVDPVTNSTDQTAVAITAVAGRDLWVSLAFVPPLKKLVSAPFSAGGLVLVVDPATNTSTLENITALGATNGGWSRITYVEQANRLLASPFNAGSVLVVSLTTDPAALASFRRIDQLIADIAAANQAVCSRPACAAGTQPVNGSCVPDCPVLRRRGVSCEPHCDALERPGSSGSASSSTLVAVIVAVVGGVGVIVCGAVVIQRRQSHPELTGKVSPVYDNAFFAKSVDHGRPRWTTICMSLARKLMPEQAPPPRRSLVLPTQFWTTRITSRSPSSKCIASLKDADVSTWDAS
eukprot:m.235725 g.235725  ORF g.235725 m.235725 type:complete len:339 (-) comp15764_c0_seq1:142-1158(-)